MSKIIVWDFHPLESNGWTNRWRDAAEFQHIAEGARFPLIVGSPSKIVGSPFINGPLHRTFYRPTPRDVLAFKQFPDDADGAGPEWSHVRAALISRGRSVADVEALSIFDILGLLRPIEEKREPSALKGTAKTIARYIEKNPGKTAKEIAKVVERSERRVLTICSAKLKPLGYTNRRGCGGYFPPAM